jgi:hypothetical protein
MVTQELIIYVRGEFAKGKTREEIRKVLLSSGGWGEDDLSEAFRIVIPMQGAVSAVPSNPLAHERPVEEKPIAPTPVIPSMPSFTPPPASATPSTPVVSASPLRSFPPISFYPPSPSLQKSASISQSPSLSPSHHTPSSLLKFLVILIIIGGLGFGAWYYRSSIMNLWNSLVNKSSQSSIPPVDTSIIPPVDTTIPPVNTTQNTDLNNQAVAPVPVLPPVIPVKDCGIAGTTLKLGTPSTYENDPALSCLGASALNCENATGILKDDFFPTIFEITKLPDSCNFKLSYPADSTLTDIIGKKLALQYISCPINIVKAIDNTNVTSPKFNTPSTANYSKYAAETYFYGTLGLFIENNLDLTKIQNLGCSGEYIQSMIASYNAKKV